MKSNVTEISLIHGLNVRPQVMQDLAIELGLNTSLLNDLALTGHKISTDRISRIRDLKNIHAQDWINDVVEQLRLNKNQSIHFGYSLGGALLLNVYSIHPELKPDKLILFAPALSFRAWTHSWKVLKPFGGLVIPSMQGRKHRVNKGVPVQAYKVLFRLSKSLHENYELLKDIPTLVLINQGDELVSPSGIRNIVKEHRLHNWEIVELSKSSLKRGKRHQIVSKECFTGNNWRVVKEKCQSFLNAET